MLFMNKSRDLLMNALHQEISSELKRAVSIFEKPAPLPDESQIRKFIHVRTADKFGKKISKFFWRNRLILVMASPHFSEGGKTLEVKFVRFLEQRRMVSIMFEYLADEHRIIKSSIGGGDSERRSA